MYRMLRGLLAAVGVALVFLTHGATAQEAQPPALPSDAQPLVLTVDIDALFARSAFGERISREYNAAREALAAENRRIAEALREEELDLAARRPEMEPDMFRAEAEAFDDNTQGIRRAQDAKEREVEETLAQGRAQFLEVTGPILRQLMDERGAVALLDRRALLLYSGSIDITDAALERINAEIGDGSNPAENVGD
ncbi:MAG: OmpH family outer membrane protein [Pseudomonadota bacterium]